MWALTCATQQLAPATCTTWPAYHNGRRMKQARSPTPAVDKARPLLAKSFSSALVNTSSFEGLKSIPRRYSSLPHNWNPSESSHMSNTSKSA